MSLGFLLLLLGVASYGHGLSCFTCNNNDFNGKLSANTNCFNVVTTGTTATATSACSDNAGAEYCRGTFTIDEGVVTAVIRGCLSTGSNTNLVPSNECTTAYTLNNNPTKTTTTCSYTCTSDNCNNNAAASFQKCSTNCNSLGERECNYINGSCFILATPTSVTRSCVQCSSETDSSCTSSKTSTPCSGSNQYCSTTVSKIFDQADNVVKTVTVRGCTDTFVATDQCSFSNVANDFPINSVGYKEFTCYSTCNSDGCNTNTANGVIDAGETVPLQCVQCSDTSGVTTCNSATTRTPCASGNTYCKSTVTYLISEKVDRSYTGVFPTDVAYEMRRVVRECATQAVTTRCSETSVSGLDGLKKVTCTETCQMDGCNTGWPARPKCIQCTSDSRIAGILSVPAVNYADGFDECLENPPVAADCVFPYQGYCVIVDVGIEKDKTSNVQGYPRRISRGCSHVDISTGCSSETVRSTIIENCNRTCTTDGCNAGSGGSMPIQTLIAVAGPAVFSWMAHMHL